MPTGANADACVESTSAVIRLRKVDCWLGGEQGRSDEGWVRSCD